MEDVRLKFRLRTMMVDAKMNFRNKKEYSKKLWLCDSCTSSIESQSHLIWCPAYQYLRENKNLNDDQDMINYIKEVLEIRDELMLRR